MEKDMTITIDSSKIRTIPLKVTSGQFVAEDEGVKKSDYGRLFYTQTDESDGITYFLRISDSIDKIGREILFEMGEKGKDRSVIRFVTNYQTTKESIDDALSVIRKAL